MRFSILNRKIHRWGALISALPILVIVLTGLILQFKKEAAWIQPPTLIGAGQEPSISFDQILDAAKGVPEGEIEAWDDIDRLDVRPGKGIVKVRSKNFWEIQVDTMTGEVIQTAYRRSDLIENLHDGSFFSPSAKRWIFLPAGVILFALLGTGVVLFFLPYLNRRGRRATNGAEVEN